jgi:16S rRNA (cytidine1402-2'-O)-methyltransferase
VAATLGDLVEACGPDRPVVVARELTKVHEEVWRGTLAEACATFSQREVRGEVVVVLAGDPGAGRPPDDDELSGALRRRLDAGDTLRDAATAVAGELAVSRRRAYDLALELRRNAEP